MAIAEAQHVLWGDSTPTLVSGTYTPGASGRLVIFASGHTAPTNAADITSVTGTSITGMTKIITKGYRSIATPLSKVEIWAGLSTGSAGAVTVSLGNSPDGGKFCISEFTGVDTAQGTNGVLVTNAVSNASDSSQTALSVTLGAFSNAANGAFACYGINAASSIAEKSGWTRIIDTNWTTPSQTAEWQWIATNDTASQATGGSSASWGACAVEIAGLSVSATPYPNVSILRRGLRGG